MQATRSLVWKTFNDGMQLRVHIYEQAASRDGSQPCIVFFHGGMWMRSYLEEIIPWALFFAKRGITFFIPEYRTREHYDLRGEEILQDGKDFWNWLRNNAEALGIAANQITLAGADAGALMALHIGMPRAKRRRLLDWRKPLVLPPMPAALAIFRGIVDSESPEAQMLNISFETRHPQRFNPSKRLRKHLPPLFCAHGERDPLQDIEASEWFCNEWNTYGNKVEYYLGARVDHTLMSFHVNPLHFEQMTYVWSEFMIAQGLWPDNSDPDDLPLMI